MNKNNLDLLKTKDVYSMILFIIFQLKQFPEYSLLSELIYLIDKESLLNLCNYFGGDTIRIPKIEELNVVIDTLLLYTYIELENKNFEDSLNLIAATEEEKNEIKKLYPLVSQIVKDYDFMR